MCPVHTRGEIPEIPGAKRRREKKEEEEEEATRFVSFEVCTKYARHAL